MWERHFDWYHFRPYKFTLTPQIGGRIGGSTLEIGIADKRRQIEQHFLLTGIGKSWVGFRLVPIPTP